MTRPEEYQPEHSHRTAISRTKPSKPLRILLKDNLLHKDDWILDYGCGKGKDVKYLKELGFKTIVGFDPYNPKYAHPENLIAQTFDVILNFYVLNVVLPDERDLILENILNLVRDNGRIYIAVRDISEKVNGTPYEDGVITSRGTFQKFFSTMELVAYILENYPDGTEVKILSRHPLGAEVFQ